ncbi:MAG: GTPase Era [Spirochaetia bacterium]
MHEQTDRNTESHAPSAGADGKSAVIAVIGRPSVGKSTLINRLCGHPVSIVTTVPQTTRNRIRAIITESRGQLVLIDTPGYHNSDKKFNRAMGSLVTEELEDADVVLAMLDMSREGGQEEQTLLATVAPYTGKTVIGLNKVDSACRTVLSVTEQMPVSSDRVIPFSAMSGEGTEQLLTLLFEMSPSGPPMYPPEYYTDQEPSFRISEVIREQAMVRTREEVPHALYVDVFEIKSPPGGERLDARAVIYTEREAQKGIIVGERGKMIRAIRIASETKLREVFERPVGLELRVKVHPKWRNRDRTIGKLIR